MVSVKTVMVCVGVDTSARTSVLGDFFGFSRRRVPTDPDPATTARVSLLEQVRAMRGLHVHVNVIRVGFDGLTGGAAALDAANDRIDYAVYRMRTIYRQANVGVGRVTHHEIATADALGYDDLGSLDECDDMIADFSIPGDGIDAFVVRNISDPDFVGKAAEIPGSCNKQDAEDGVCAGEIGRPAEAFARTFAHEIGHHLGLEHNHGGPPECPDAAGCDNLMAQTRCATSCGNGVRAAVNLTAAQGTVMRQHCSIRGGCT
jgi:Metallo-peptidase family M12B Reprolysin-like